MLTPMMHELALPVRVPIPWPSSYLAVPLVPMMMDLPDGWVSSCNCLSLDQQLILDVNVRAREVRRADGKEARDAIADARGTRLL